MDDKEQLEASLHVRVSRNIVFEHCSHTVVLENVCAVVLQRATRVGLHSHLTTESFKTMLTVGMAVHGTSIFSRDRWVYTYNKLPCERNKREERCSALARPVLVR